MSELVANPGSKSHSRSRLIRNSVANVSRGLATGVVALVLPALILRSLPKGEFAVWILILQIATYVALLEAGLQVTVGKFVAQEVARDRIRDRDSYFLAGMVLLGGCAVIGFAVIGVFALGFPVFFPKIPVSQLSLARESLLYVGGSAALSLPAAAATGVFIGLERNSVPAILIGGGRLLQCVITAAVAANTRHIIPTAMAFGFVSLLITLSQFIAVKFISPKITPSTKHLSRPVFKNLVSYSATLSLWTAAGILVTGLDIPIVARFDFPAVTPYALSATLIAVFVGLASLLFNALLPRVSALVALNREAEVRDLLLNSTRLCCAIVVVAGLAGYYGSEQVLRLWVGNEMAKSAAPIVKLLIIANAVRMPLIPFSLVLMGSGFHVLARYTPIAEGLSNVVTSLFLASMMGSIGVAIGTIVGAAVGITLAIALAMPKAKTVSCSVNVFLIDGIGRVLVLGLPWILVGCFFPVLSSLAKTGLCAVAFLITVLILATVTLKTQEWEFVIRTLKRRMKYLENAEII